MIWFYIEIEGRQSSILVHDVGKNIDKSQKNPLSGNEIEIHEHMCCKL